MRLYEANGALKAISDKSDYRLSILVCVLVALAILIPTASGQSAPPTADATADRAISLTEQGRCTEALPLLMRILPKLTGKHIRYAAGMAETRCAMALEQQDTALSALQQLRREFPDDPEVLYITVHYLSQMAMITSRELAAKAPNSSQAIRLEAEAFESQGKWDEAAGLYKEILERNPGLPGIHYRLGQVLLSKAGETGPVDQARAEFEKELQIDPHNAAAEFVLGQIAQHAGQWEQAVGNFSRATKLDVGFAEAYLGLGMSLASLSKFAEAVTPLEKYVKMVPADPAGHYQLAMAYRRTGNAEGAAREVALQKQVAK
jgi:tetratricopeptide (TPR) repeat protein